MYIVFSNLLFLTKTSTFGAPFIRIKRAKRIPFNVSIYSGDHIDHRQDHSYVGQRAGGTGSGTRCRFTWLRPRSFRSKYRSSNPRVEITCGCVCLAWQAALCCPYEQRCSAHHHWLLFCNLTPISISATGLDARAKKSNKYTHKYSFCIDICCAI